MSAADMTERQIARFWTRVEKTETCWLWTGSRTTGGYGNLRVPGSFDYAHRVAYMHTVGPIPDGLHLDHLCRVRHCCNPAHLEPVSAAENTRRGLAGYGLRTECKHGHDITDPANVYTDPTGGHRCRTCARLRDRARYAARSTTSPRELVAA